MTATATGRSDASRRGVQRRQTDWVGYVLVSFFTVPFFLFNIGPILFGAYVAFTKWGIFGRPRWISWQNFAKAFHDGFAIIAFENTLLYGLVIVPSVTVIAFTFAVYVNQRWPLAGLARALFFAPYVVSATVIGLVWVWMLDTQFGLINHYLSYLGIGPVPWLTSTSWSLIGVSIATIWWDLGLVFVLFLAALQDVPRELYEAAEVDGASRWQRLGLVTIPQLRPVISLCVTLQVISSLRIFSPVYVMTNGGPASSSSSVIYYIYTTAIFRQMFGYASAVSVLLFMMILIITVIHRTLMREL
jgi:multiple sugar transport system permease protein